MQSWWLTFTDGSEAGCDGEAAYDAKIIAEHFTGKTVAGGVFTNIAAQILPYPCKNMIWRYEHPVHGKCPAFCYTPKRCAGLTACPHRAACSE